MICYLSSCKEEAFGEVAFSVRTASLQYKITQYFDAEIVQLKETEMKETLTV